MQPRSNTPHVQSAAHAGFGAGLLAALHDSRRRQAAREIYNHRHLIEDAKSVEMRRALGCAPMNRRETRPSWGRLPMPALSKIAVGAIVALFLALHVTGAALMMSASDQAPAPAAVILSGD
jgi:hypothetical protein